MEWSGGCAQIHPHLSSHSTPAPLSTKWLLYMGLFQPQLQARPLHITAIKESLLCQLCLKPWGRTLTQLLAHTTPSAKRRGGDSCWAYKNSRCLQQHSLLNFLLGFQYRPTFSMCPVDSPITVPIDGIHTIRNTVCAMDQLLYQVIPFRIRIHNNPNRSLLPCSTSSSESSFHFIAFNKHPRKKKKKKRERFF